METVSSCFEIISKNKSKSAITLIVGSLGLLCSRYIYLSLYKKYVKLPSGPIGIPIFGSLISMGMDQYKFISKSMKSYGDISCCMLGQKRFILCNSPKIVKEIYIKNKLIDVYPLTPKSNKNDLMFIGINGSEWIKRRKIIHQNLMNVLTSNVIQYISIKTLKSTIYPKIDEWIKNKTKTGFNTNGIFSPVTFNVVFFAIFGCEFDDKFYDKFTKVQKALFSSVGAEHAMRYVFSIGK